MIGRNHLPFLAIVVWLTAGDFEASRELLFSSAQTIAYTQSTSSCTAFSSIAGQGTKLDVGHGIDPTIAVTLVTPFNFLGTRDEPVLTITQDGTINLGNVAECAMSGITPIVDDATSTVSYDHVPRISVSQATGSKPIPSSVGSGVYHLDKGSSNVFSWELVSIGYSRMSYQAELFENGDIEMRYDYLGSYAQMLTVTVGVEDESLGVAFPKDGCPDGVCSGFPQSSCVRFTVVSP